MARAITTSRYSRTADRQGPANQSPFRSAKPSKRYDAALEMIQKREDEMEDLEKALAKSMSYDEQKRLSERILASKNNRDSWVAYIENNWPRESRAVIVGH